MRPDMMSYLSYPNAGVQSLLPHSTMYSIVHIGLLVYSQASLIVGPSFNPP